MPPFPITPVMETLRTAAEALPRPVVTALAQSAPEGTRDAFKVLISTLLSLRTKDETTDAASQRLFARAGTCAAMLELDEAEIARLIFPVGFYRVKARTILEVCRRLEDEHAGEVPEDLDALMTFKGVGRKTANLVLTLGHGLPGICVDTHVHRICNRWGYVRTKSPDATELILRRKLPRPYWIPINDWLVAWGQFVCRPISPRCTECALAPWCKRVGVTVSR